MADQDLEVEHAQTPEQEAAEDAAFEAAFNTTRGDKPHGEGSTPMSADDEQQPPAANAQPDEAQAEADAQAKANAEAQAAEQERATAEAEANAPATITRAELDALRSVAGQVTALQDELKRSNDKTFGHIGSLKQTLDAVKAQAQQGVKPTLNQLKRLEGEFPELAKLLSQDLEDAFGPGNATSAAPEQAHGDGKASGAEAPGAEHADPLDNPIVKQRLMAAEMAIVDAAHPDWRDLKDTPEFNEWRSGLPAAAQQLLGSTWDSKVLRDALSDFKGWNQKRGAAQEANKQRAKRLEAGIQPTSGTPTGAAAIDEDAAFLAGFNKTRGGR